MLRSFTALFAVAVAAGLTLATPSTSQAQDFGLRIDVGSSNFRYNQGYYGRGYGRPYPYYGSYYGGRPWDHDHHHGHYHHARRPVIVQPHYYHWTPDRGYHSHGEVLVPHRGHYDSYRY